jgi:hypothetical protein
LDERAAAHVEGSLGVACDETEDEDAVAVMDVDHKACLDGFQAWVVESGDGGRPDEMELVVVVVVVVYCVAVADDIAVEVEGLEETCTAVGEEGHRALDLAEGSYMAGVEWAVEEVVGAGSELNARRVHDDSDLFCSAQNIVCRSSTEPGKVVK